MAYWLVKSEPDVYSIDDLSRDKVTQWDCVRNYQARNNLRAMAVGDKHLFYHSNAEPSGIAGIAKVKEVAYPDLTQFDKSSEYYEKRATKSNPVWYAPDIQFVAKFAELVTLDELRSRTQLKDMIVLKRGMRLSVQPVKESEFNVIVKLRS